MDTSKEYIGMCERAGEIQELREYKEGDWFIYEDADVPLVLGQVVEGGDETTLFDEFVVGMKEEKELWTWLPRQDQLQEMVGDWCEVLERFYDWITDEGYADPSDPDYQSAGFNLYFVERFSSMEQLWLIFVMQEKYNKTWNGEDWE